MEINCGLIVGRTLAILTTCFKLTWLQVTSLGGVPCHSCLAFVDPFLWLFWMIKIVHLTGTMPSGATQYSQKVNKIISAYYPPWTLQIVKNLISVKLGLLTMKVPRYFPKSGWYSKSITKVTPKSAASRLMIDKK